eukprot:Em0002g1352a
MLILVTDKKQAEQTVGSILTYGIGQPWALVQLLQQGLSALRKLRKKKFVAAFKALKMAVSGGTLWGGDTHAVSRQPLPGNRHLQQGHRNLDIQIRASFASQSYGPLCFQKGNVLLVTDTCLEGRPGYWYAMKATSDGHSTEGDMFPLNQRNPSCKYWHLSGVTVEVTLLCIKSHD